MRLNRSTRRQQYLLTPSWMIGNKISHIIHATSVRHPYTFVGSLAVVLGNLCHRVGGKLALFFFIGCATAAAAAAAANANAAAAANARICLAMAKNNRTT